MPGSHNSGFELAERLVDTIRIARNRAVIPNIPLKFCSPRLSGKGVRRVGNSAAGFAAAYFGAEISVFSS